MLPTNEARRRALLPPPEPRDGETRRELAKLTATYYNGLAVSVFAVGGLAPLVAGFSQSPIDLEAPWIAVLSLAAFALSLVAHLVARYVPRREFRR
ncbi:hypothetical protein [Aureimonas populi]|nr:hypothetical protein [Aureimonas populi]